MCEKRITLSVALIKVGLLINAEKNKRMATGVDDGTKVRVGDIDVGDVLILGKQCNCVI